MRNVSTLTWAGAGVLPPAMGEGFFRSVADCVADITSMINEWKSAEPASAHEKLLKNQYLSSDAGEETGAPNSRRMSSVALVPMRLAPACTMAMAAEAVRIP